MIGTAALCILLSCSTAGPADRLPAVTLVQPPESGWTFGVRAGGIRHDAFGSTHNHATAGVRAGIRRSGGLSVGAFVDWWPDELELGPTLDDRTVSMSYISYGLDLRSTVGRVARGDVFVGIGAGGETVLFGERHGAEAILPESSTYPAGWLGAGVSLPPIESEPSFRLDLELRAYAAHAPVFDPFDADEDEEIAFSQALTLGVSYLF